MKLLFSGRAWADYQHWIETDRDGLARVNLLIRDASRSPFSGVGKPEPLSGKLKGWWSRRITAEHRLLYRVQGSGEGQTLEIAACRFHYDRR
ncbi:Txe/YoeB family addiction module toxin [Aurantimonas sp. MSK8Z-1]|uniref:Txe/YoeB family addiction module toxin n=1 Tax=Mangrovibrevibacter kandeliae TaxID=2968473 RepID=UPI00211953F7|nr:Txe/YoeB family addiction module toxin [Aurantimonas sp. MSK8Z-1]MCW4115097.1 Txe/YoeB family addiction module toxin [Aurantimonas sp. MSK8Z-1]